MIINTLVSDCNHQAYIKIMPVPKPLKTRGSTKLQFNRVVEIFPQPVNYFSQIEI